MLRRVLDVPRIAELRRWVEELSAHPGIQGGLMHHFEQTDSGAVIARTERFADVHQDLGEFVREDVASVVQQLVGEPVVLFKEKVNYKYPGGAGFAPHQDARAYRFARRHVSVMIPLDPATEASGCLWFAPNPGHRALESDERGRITDRVIDGLEWYPVEVSPGDVVMFNSSAPHRSETNTSEHPRRAMYLTYNSSAEGDFRQRYYADKATEFAAVDGTFGGDRVRISISDDFLGRPVTKTGELAPGGGGDVVEQLVELYSSDAAEQFYDEAVTELQHALQAGWLAERQGVDTALVVAALLHDVGHLLVGDLLPIDIAMQGDEHHEAVGAAWLQPSFGPDVAGPVALHVDAKRYLCAVQQDYLASLTASSVRSLGVQGGPMSAGEIVAFEAKPRIGRAVMLRRWDDQAKIAGAQTPSFAHFVPLLRSLLRD